MQPIDLRQVQVGQTLNGYLYVQDYTKKLDKTSKAPLYGNAYYKGKVLKFKVWDERLQNIFNNGNLTGSIIRVNTTIGTYKDQVELTINEAYFEGNEGVSKHSFFKSVDVETIFKEFADFVNTNLSQSSLAILSTIFQSDNLYEPFKYAWAAQKMHDAQVGGLVNHTMKMLKIARTLVESDPRLEKYKDYLYLGIIFHDIGKIEEIGEGGSYNKDSFAGHRVFAVELLAKHKDFIIKTTSKHFYYILIDIIVGHHGEWGDKPTTIWGYIVHLIDMLDSQVTGLMDRIENGEISEINGNKVVWCGDGLLAF